MIIIAKMPRKTTKKCYRLSTPLFFENSTDFLHYFFDFQKKKGGRGVSKFPNKKILLGSKINSRRNHGNKDYFVLALGKPIMNNNNAIYRSNKRNNTYIIFTQSINMWKCTRLSRMNGDMYCSNRAYYIQST